MDSQIANDLDQILTVLSKHFGNQPQKISQGVTRSLSGDVLLAVIIAIFFGGLLYFMFKLAFKGDKNVIPNLDDRVYEAEVQELIMRNKRMIAQHEAQIDNIDAMYQAVVNPPQRTAAPIDTPINYGNPNRLPPPRKIGSKNNYGPGWVYLIAGDGAHKIGLATDPDARLSNLQTASHKQLAMVHKIKTNNMRALEAELHRKYADKRLNGEWFALTPVDVAEICLIKDEVVA